MNAIVFNKYSNKIILLFILLYSLWGVVGNLLYLSSSTEFNGISFLLLLIFSVLINLTIISLITLSILKYNFNLYDWGFTRDKGCWISLLITIFCLVIVGFQVGLHVSLNDFFLPLYIVSSINEELILRVLFINNIIILFSNSKYKAIIAILISSILFTFIHIPTKNGYELISLFTSSLILGYIYYKTKSVLFLIFVHVIGNTAGSSGLLGGLISIVIYFSIALIPKLKRR